VLRNPTEYVEVKLRVPKDLRLKLEAEATRRQSSLNGETLRRIESSFDDKPRATLATAAEDYGTSAQDIRLVTTQMETAWRQLEATQTFLLLADLITTKILDRGERDEAVKDLVVYARDLRRLRASVEQRCRETVWPSGEDRS
jgi:hypothetical protein